MSEPPRLQPHPVLAPFYRDPAERRACVDAMFDASAALYDRINAIMSFGSGVWYRRQALQRAGLAPGQAVLDVGSGTGVLAVLAQEQVGPEGRVYALDPSAGMLAQARARGVRHAVRGLGERLPFPDDAFDLVVMGYALRHVEDLLILFREYHRVLRPGGRVLLLEITRPAHRFGRALLKAYLKWYVPTVTRVLLRSSEGQKLMRYYWETIEHCVPPETIVEALRAAGFADAGRHVVMGLFSEYGGRKPEGERDVE